jgi:DTW domain-containing protein
MSRITCNICYRPELLCYCSVIKPIDNRIKITIIQHPTEQKHPFNTGRIIDLCLTNSELIVKKSLSTLDLDSILSIPSVLLYPDMAWLPDVEKLTLTLDNSLPQVATAEKNEFVKSIKQVIIIDATWRKSKRIMFQHQRLQHLPRINLIGSLETNYRVRKGSEIGGLNSIESCFHSLSFLEPESNFANLLTTFEKMVSLQLNHSKHPTIK